MNTLELIEPEKPAICGNDVVLLPYGLIGFERVKNYSLLADPRAEPFLWFRMLKDDKHAFLVMPPATVIPDYQPDLEDLDVEFLELEASSDVLILNTVTLRGLGQATINLKGPIVINRRTWIGKQVIPGNADQYSVRHPLPLF